MQTMHISIARVLVHEQVDALRTGLAHATFEDGRMSAGPLSARVKSNTQARGPDAALAGEMVRDALLRHPVVAMAARPKSIIGPTFSRYETGQFYGQHIDEPIMDGRRTDLAFTLFLSEPAAYDGGELIIGGTDGDNVVKLAAGDVHLYPATTLHRVAPVLRGERFAAVGWIRSHVRRADQRELLFDLDTAYHRLFEAHGKTAEVDLLAKTLANLIRQWCDD